MSGEVAKTWDNTKFEEMSWNSNRLYGIIFPGREHLLKLFVDHILSGPITDRSLATWELVPVEILFENVINFELVLTTKNFSELDIIEISRSNERPTPNGKMRYQDYVVELAPEGLLKFTATSFRQTAVGEKQYSDTADLDRELQI